MLRIGTWNLNKQWDERHIKLLNKQECDIWLLTEVNPKAKDSKGMIADFNCHHSAGVMAQGQYWAAVLCTQTLMPLPDPHPASAAAVVNGITFCSTILPWGGCGTQPPWVGTNLEEMAIATIESLKNQLPESNLVWGGDWNQNLCGVWENVGSKASRDFLESTIATLELQVPTAGLPYRLSDCRHTIDHIAVPSAWEVTSTKQVAARGRSWEIMNATQVPARGLSDHDAYVIEILEN
jgi:hypothetical protein